MWPFTCLFVNLLNYLVKFQIIYKLDSILNVIIDKYTYWLDGHLDLKVTSIMSINISDNYLPYYVFEILIHFTWLPVRTGLMDIVFHGRFRNNLHIQKCSSSFLVKWFESQINWYSFTLVVQLCSCLECCRSWIFQASVESNRQIKDNNTGNCCFSAKHKH